MTSGGGGSFTRVSRFFYMAPTKKKRKVSDLTVDDANALLYTLAEFQAQLDEEDEDLPNGLIDGLEELRKKLSNYPGVHWSSKPICVQR